MASRKTRSMQSTMRKQKRKFVHQMDLQEVEEYIEGLGAKIEHRESLLAKRAAEGEREYTRKGRVKSLDVLRINLARAEHRRDYLKSRL